MKPRIKTIIECVAKEFAIPIKFIHDRDRKHDVLIPRMIAMYLSKEMTNRSWKDIGYFIGLRHYATIIHGHKKISGLILTNNYIAKKIEKLKPIIIESEKASCASGPATASISLQGL